MPIQLKAQVNIEQARSIGGSNADWNTVIVKEGNDIYMLQKIVLIN